MEKVFFSSGKGFLIIKITKVSTSSSSGRTGTTGGMGAGKIRRDLHPSRGGREAVAAREARLLRVICIYLTDKGTAVRVGEPTIAPERKEQL